MNDFHTGRYRNGVIQTVFGESIAIEPPMKELEGKIVTIFGEREGNKMKHEFHEFIWTEEDWRSLK